jgi:site-specific DNA recombinase
MNVTRSCVLYARKSTDREDKQILSIPSQLRELREYAARSGLVITNELVESCSARKPGRPVFSRLLKDAGTGRVERVLAWRLDRLARNPVDGGQLIYMLAENKLKELVTPEGTYTGAGDSKFMLSVLFGAATKMSDDLSAGVRRGVREVWKRGQIPGRPPIGYVKTRQGVGPKQTGRVVPDPERFMVVKRIWQEMATGNRTVAQVWRRAVRDWGFRTETGRRPTTTILYKLLRNPFYMGFIATPEGTFKGEHPPMVTRDEFDRVQKAVKRQGTARPVRHDFLYRCFLVCRRCGRRYVGERITKTRPHDRRHECAFAVGCVTDVRIPSQWRVDIRPSATAIFHVTDEVRSIGACLMRLRIHPSWVGGPLPELFGGPMPANFQTAVQPKPSAPTRTGMDHLKTSLSQSVATSVATTTPTANTATVEMIAKV